MPYQKNNKAYRLARLIQQASRTIDFKKRMILKSAFRYESYPVETHKRKNKITELRSILITLLMQELLGNEYNPGTEQANIWVSL
jgi:hypothetical protein